MYTQVPLKGTALDMKLKIANTLPIAKSPKGTPGFFKKTLG